MNGVVLSVGGKGLCGTASNKKAPDNECLKNAKLVNNLQTNSLF